MQRIDLNSLSIEQKIGQLFFIGIPGPELDVRTRQILSDISPGGVCLFARNIKELGQTRELLDSIDELLPVPPFLSVDQEGGRVDRLRRVLEPMPAASRLRTSSDAGSLGEIIGEALSILGFNMDFAPVVDVIAGARRDLSNGLQTRGMGTSKEEVSAFAAEFLGALSRHGILGCAKHFPGLAASEVDSHEELPVVNIEKTELWDNDLFPYRELLPGRADLCVMIAHAAYPNTDLQETDANGKLIPSSLSKRVVTSLLRDELNFNGVAITDDLEMGAILRNYGIGEACKMAIRAGEDMLAICASPDAIYSGFEAVSRAVQNGETSESRLDESLCRIFELKELIGPRIAFDDGRLAELSLSIKKLNENLN